MEPLEQRHMLASGMYVILTTTAIESGSTQLANFVADLADRGYTPVIKTQADWGGGIGDVAAENLKNWLGAHIVNDNITNVLLLGDPTASNGNVPMKMVYPRNAESDDKETPTDYYYAAALTNWDADGDLLPGEWQQDLTSVPQADVAVGRIPVYGTDYTTLDAILTKSIAYERATNEMWRKNILLPMPIVNYEDEEFVGQQRTDAAQLGETITSDIAALQNYTAYTLYEKGGDAPSTYTPSADLTQNNLLTQWNANPYGFAEWWGFGDATHLNRKVINGTTITTPVAMANTDTPDLNDVVPSFVFLASPFGGKPDDTANLAYSLLKEGAIGTLAAAGQTYYVDGNWTPSDSNGDTGSLAFWHTKIAIENLDMTAAQAWNQTLRDHVGTGMNADTLMNAFTINLYGDPTIIPRQNNHAPVLDATPDLGLHLADIAENSTGNNGTLVSDLLASGAVQPIITDADRFQPQGIAVTAVYNSVEGSFQFSTNNGATWTDFGSPTPNAARLLASDTQTRIRFVPALNYNGSKVGFEFCAWDQSGAAGNGAVDNAAVTGDQTPYSTNNQTASVTVWEVNNPPSLIAGSVNDLAVSQNSGTTSLGFGGLQFSNGDETYDSDQTMVYTVTAVPAPTLGDVVLADGSTVVIAGQEYTLAQIQGMQFRATADAFGGPQPFTFELFNGGNTHGVADPKTISETSNISVWRVKDTIGQYNKTASVFFLRNSQSTGFADIAFGFGAAGWLPLTGDWNNDQVDTVGLYDPATSVFYLRNANSTGMADVAFGFGAAGAGWIPLSGDWNGDGTDTSGLYDPATSLFYLRNSHTTGPADIAFGFGGGGLGWLPITGDWDGDGTDTIGLYDPHTAVYYLRNSNSTGFANLAFGFGAANAGWTPLAGDWDHDGIDTIGAFYPAAALYFLRNSNSVGFADRAMPFGSTGATVLPVTGDWNGPDGFPLAAETIATPAADLAPLTDEELRPMLAAALARWSAAGLSSEAINALAATQVVVTDLPGAELGYTTSAAIYIDRDAAGHGWFVDATPLDDAEFAAAVAPQAADRMDLLTVLAHEVGHRAGLSAHLEDGLMEATLASGARRLPCAREVEQVFAQWR